MSVFGMPASNDLAMIGSSKPLAFDLKSLETTLADAEVRNDLGKVGIEEPFEILSYFVLDKEAVGKIVGVSAPNTDNNPIVEFSAPKFLYSSLAINPWRVILDNLSPISSVLTDPRSSAEKPALISAAESFRRSRLLTQIHFIERNIGEGIEEGEKALAIDGDNPFLAETVARLYFEEGSSFLNQGEYSASITSFERSLELKETSEAYVNLGLSFEGQGILPKAKEAYEVAIELDGEFEGAYIQLGKVFAELGDLNGAIEAYEQVAKLNPQNTTALVNLGNLYILRKDFGRAEGYLNRALKLDPELEEAKALLNTLP